MTTWSMNLLLVKVQTWYEKIVENSKRKKRKNNANTKVIADSKSTKLCNCLITKWIPASFSVDIDDSYACHADNWWKIDQWMNLLSQLCKHAWYDKKENKNRSKIYKHIQNHKIVEIFFFCVCVCVCVENYIPTFFAKWFCVSNLFTCLSEHGAAQLFKLKLLMHEVPGSVPSWAKTC